jgi:hypothetical protein
MSFENPTRLRLGMRANIRNRNYQLVGRVVLGVTDNGVTYYWNEFNLQAADGTTTTLVYEEGEQGGEWRLFLRFEPETPLTAAEAATRRVGDPLDLNGTEVRITLLDTSRVYYIEGQGPEGLAVGDEANYFNAETSGVMQVVSWTGEEVEFYNGVNLSRWVVNSAFDLPPEPRVFGGGHLYFALIGTGSGGSVNTVVGFIGIGCAVVALIGFAGGFGSARSTSAPVPHLVAGAAPLTVGMAGKLFDKYYHVTAHALVEIARVGMICDRHEYELADDQGRKTLLVFGNPPADGDCILFAPSFPMAPPSAQQLAAKKVGDPVGLDGFTGTVQNIFLSTIKQSDADGASGLQAGTVWYGLDAKADGQWLLARWNLGSLNFYQGLSVAAPTVTTGFSAAK